ncbi:MAG: hypothetical protein GF349_03685 [Candidatus Magasanikbacteria bacterium]|nr:hypothetical protein [Candidatus Magasanikbacteria bacterium]
MEWRYEFIPEVDFNVISDKPNRKKLLFNKPLFQDTVYRLLIYQKSRTYNTENFDDIDKSDFNSVSNTEFKTVSAPAIRTYEPRGYKVHLDSIIKIEFDEAMSKEVVENSFMIKPSVDGKFEWPDERILVFRPTENLANDTDYVVSLSSGLANENGGKTTEDIELRFRTIGSVLISDLYPVSGSYGVDTKLSRVVIEFDQEVDHGSAEAAFSIYPYVPGTFSWKDNSMVYIFSRYLDFSTQYTVSLKAGIKSIYGKDLGEDYTYYFTTKDKIFTLPVPQYNQQDTFTCNIAATRIVLAYRGVYLTESDIIGGVGEGDDPNEDWVSNYGVHWGPIASFISRYRNVAVKKGWNLQDLLKEVQKGNPVIVWWHNNYSKAGEFELESGATGYRGMHSEVVRGFTGDVEDPGYILTSDPWRGSRKYSVQDFLSTWTYLGNTAIVVY